MPDNFDEDDDNLKPIDTDRSKPAPLADIPQPNFDIPVEPEPDNKYVIEENLVNKGDYFDLRRKVPHLRSISIGSGWDVNLFEEKPLDVDLSCFILDKNGQTREDEDFVFYNNQNGCNGAVRHQGDSRTGAGDGDDESILIDLDSLPFDVVKLVFALTIYSAAEREQDFSQVRNLYMRIINTEDNNELFRYKVTEDEFKGEYGIRVFELHREGPKWFFSATGEPIPGGLGAIAGQTGIIIAL